MTRCEQGNGKRGTDPWAVFVIPRRVLLKTHPSNGRRELAATHVPMAENERQWAAEEEFPPGDFGRDTRERGESRGAESSHRKFTRTRKAFRFPVPTFGKEALQKILTLGVRRKAFFLRKGEAWKSLTRARFVKL